jgi:hypothetical protein
MPVSFEEEYDSRKVTADGNVAAESAELTYTLRGVADENSASALAGSSTAAWSPCWPRWATAPAGRR